MAINQGQYLYIGDRAYITCFSHGISIVDNFHWKLNGSIYNEAISNISTSYNPYGSHLIWHSISKLYNNTIIACEANYSDGTISTSNEVTILVQGKLIIFWCYCLNCDKVLSRHRQHLYAHMYVCMYECIYIYM